MIGKRLSDLSCDEQEFNKIKQPYEEALAWSEHPNILQFQPPSQRNKRIRHCRVTWFCPPYSDNVKTEKRSCNYYGNISLTNTVTLVL